MFLLNSSPSVGEVVALTVLGFSVTRSEASFVPPGPSASRMYVVEASGVTVLKPEAGTVPRPAIVISVEFVVCDDSVVV